MRANLLTAFLSTTFLVFFCVVWLLATSHEHTKNVKSTKKFPPRNKKRAVSSQFFRFFRALADYHTLPEPFASLFSEDCGQRFFYFSFLKHARKNHQNRFTRHYSSSTSKSCLATSYRHYIFWTRVKVVVRHGMFFITRRLLYYLFLRARGKTGGEELFFSSSVRSFFGTL